MKLKRYTYFINEDRDTRDTQFTELNNIILKELELELKNDCDLEVTVNFQEINMHHDITKYIIMVEIEDRHDINTYVKILSTIGKKMCHMFIIEEESSEGNTTFFDILEDDMINNNLYKSSKGAKKFNL